jgi:hypothetical protein
MAYLLKLSECTMGLPPFALRVDAGALITLSGYLPALFQSLLVGPTLQVGAHACLEIRS